MAKKKVKVKLEPLPVGEIELPLDLQRIDNIVLVKKDSNGKTIKTRWYMIEMDGKNRDDYMNFTATRMSTNAEGEATIKNFSGMQAQLLVSVMRRESDNEPPTLEEVQSWPSSSQKRLHDWAQQLNKLASTEEDDAEGN